MERGLKGAHGTDSSGVHVTEMTFSKLTAKSLGTLSFTKLTYPVSPGHLPFLSTLYWSHLPLASAAAAFAAFCSAA